MHRNSFDADLIGKIILAVGVVGCVGCFGLAASALAAIKGDAGIVSVTSSAQHRPGAMRTRVGVMTERVDGNRAAEMARIDR